MANPKTPDTETDLRAEFNELRAQVNELVHALKSKTEEKAGKLNKKLEDELEHIQEKAEEKFHEAYEAGDASLNELNDHIRKNPMSSLAIAFVVGYAVSKIMGQSK